MDQLDLWWQQLVDTISHDRMSLTATDFHQHPWSGDDTPNLISRILYKGGVPIFIDVFHADADPAVVADLMPPERPTGASAGATHWMYQVHSRPAFFLIDKAGTVRHCTGKDSELREWIRQLLGE